VVGAVIYGITAPRDKHQPVRQMVYFIAGIIVKITTLLFTLPTRSVNENQSLIANQYNQ